MNYEPGTGTPNNASLQERIYQTFAGELAKEYWMQSSGKVSSSMALIHSASYVCSSGRLVKLEENQCSSNASLTTYSLVRLTQRIGIHLGPTQWTVNGKAIKHIYNAEDGQVGCLVLQTQKIVDSSRTRTIYKNQSLPDSNPESCIEDKFRVTKAHL